ncbi:LLM class flavin-dependent oxidoreductase [Saccharothrix sp.]|uniref:LLM class flavin-dependent oxidoreductase n=1 Tax=Saccharothrix sp. TaxID=1873460 RepID=UPI0028115ABC|nr:LLM class flavin-dependent oxidoreductase [Saccharothrix sp.]
MAAVQVGIALPVRETAILGYPDAGPLMKMAQQVEELGFDSVWVGDSFVARHRLEPLTLLAAIAMITNRVTIGTAALTAVLRDPLYLAHILVTLDQLAGDRLRIALGTGFPLPAKAELDAVTTTYSQRAGRVDEAVEFWKRHWRGEDGDFVGKHVDLTGLENQSPPTTPGGPKIWLASNGKPRAVARTGAQYDGWLPVRIDPDEYRVSLRQIREVAEAAGRDPLAIEPSLYITVNINDDPAEALAGLEDYTDRYNNMPIEPLRAYQLYYGGSAKDFTSYLAEYVEAGARHIVLRMGTFDHYERNVRAIAEGVMPALHAMNVD